MSPEGNKRPLVRMGGRDVETVDQFAKLEAVLGDYGGQMSSFEWVFSPRGDDGRPRLMFDRASGRIDRDVATYWVEHFDISRLLVQRAPQLSRRLRGKIHIVVGTADTFYLDRPVRTLQNAISSLNYKATFTYLTGRTHFDLYDGGLLTRIAMQMYDVARPNNRFKPTRAPESATALTPVRDW
jgi:hypothetical protein